MPRQMTVSLRTFQLSVAKLARSAVAMLPGQELLETDSLTAVWPLHPASYTETPRFQVTYSVMSVHECATLILITESITVIIFPMPKEPLGAVDVLYPSVVRLARSEPVPTRTGIHF